MVALIVVNAVLIVSLLLVLLGYLLVPPPPIYNLRTSLNRIIDTDKVSYSIQWGSLNKYRYTVSVVDADGNVLVVKRNYTSTHYNTPALSTNSKYHVTVNTVNMFGRSSGPTTISLFT